MSRIGFALSIVLTCVLAVAPASSQPLVKSAVQVDAGNTKQTGQNFGYSLSYNCSNTSGPCLSSEVDDLLPAQVQFVSTATTTDVGADRWQFAGGWYVTDNILLKGEYVTQKYTGYAPTSILNGAKFNGFIFEGAVAF